jgi:antirestriction protein ArdC
MRNFITGNTYTGENLVILLQAEFVDPNFMTFKQALNVGRVVKKGEKGIGLKRVVTVKKVDKKTGKEKVKRVPKFFTVFNLTQTEELA